MTMKKKIVLMGIAVFLLAGALVAVSLIQKNAAPEEESSDYTDMIETYLLENTREDIDHIELITQEDTIILEPGEYNMTGTLQWHIRDHEDWTLVSTYQNIVRMAVNFPVYMRIEENVTDSARLSDFGLLEPTSTLIVHKKDGTSEKVFIGIRSSDGEYAFARKDGDHTVYACNSEYANYASFTKTTIRLAQITDMEVEGEITEFFAQKKGERAVEIFLDEEEDRVSALTDGSVYISTPYKFREPYHNLHLEVMGDINGKYLKNLTEPEIHETVDPDCSDFEQYGLSEESPEYRERITVRTGNEGDYTYTTTDYLFGYQYGEGLIYFREAGSTLVLGVDISCMANRSFTPFFFVNKLIYINSVANIESGSVSFRGHEHDFLIKRGDPVEDESASETERLRSFRIDDYLVEPDVFRALYRTIIEVAPDYEILNEKPEIDESDKLTAHFKYFDGTEETLEYYRMSEFYYVTQIDETTWFACGHSYFDRIEEQLVHIEEVLADNPNEE